MEAAACRLKQLCPSIGVARDILDPLSLFESTPQAAQKIIDDIRKSILGPTVEPQFSRWHSSHTTPVLAAELVKLYEDLPSNEAFQNKIPAQRPSFLAAQISQLRFTFQRRTRDQSLPSAIRWNHLAGRNADLDEIMEWVRATLREWNITCTNSSDAQVEVAGWPIHEARASIFRFQFLVHGVPSEKILSGATLVVPAVQDVLNLRIAEIWNPSITLPVPMRPLGEPEEWHILNPGDASSSIPVWRALAARRAVLYPRSSPYFEQVFWGGLAFDGCSESFPKPPAGEILPLIRIPEAASPAANLRKLLSF
jgi:hypothetical protein